jgi:hypothetical protein
MERERESREEEPFELPDREALSLINTGPIPFGDVDPSSGASAVPPPGYDTSAPAADAAHDVGTTGAGSSTGSESVTAEDRSDTFSSSDSASATS